MIYSTQPKQAPAHHGSQWPIGYSHRAPVQQAKVPVKRK